MNKKLLAVAVAGALAAPALAFAQASTVQIYGRANLGWDNYSATGATAPGAGGAAPQDVRSRNRVYDAGSRIGFRGTEALGGGLNALFLIEHGVAADTGAQIGQNYAANSSTGLGARVAYVGLQGSWGQLTLGRQNTWWGNGQNEQWQTNYGSVGNQFFTGGFGRGMGNGVARLSNAMQYLTPTWNGFNAVLTYSPGPQETAGAGRKTDGRVWAVTINGQVGSIVGGYDWVNNRGNSPERDAFTAAQITACDNGTNAKTTCEQGQSTGNKLKVGWLYQPGANISLFYVRNEVQNGGGPLSSPVAVFTQAVPATVAATQTTTGNADVAANTLKQQGWGLVWEHTWGNFGVEVNYSKLGDISGCVTANLCSDTNNNTWFVGGRYHLSKRTHLMAFWLSLRNAANYNADPAAGGTTSAQVALGAGADPRIYGVGMLHNF